MHGHAHLLEELIGHLSVRPHRACVRERSRLDLAWLRWNARDRGRYCARDPGRRYYGRAASILVGHRCHLCVYSRSLYSTWGLSVARGQGKWAEGQKQGSRAKANYITTMGSDFTSLIADGDVMASKCSRYRACISPMLLHVRIVFYPRPGVNGRGVIPAGNQIRERYRRKTRYHYSWRSGGRAIDRCISADGVKCQDLQPAVPVDMCGGVYTHRTPSYL